jgi:hypothetical protein
MANWTSIYGTLDSERNNMEYLIIYHIIKWNIFFYPDRGQTGDQTGNDRRPALTDRLDRRPVLTGPVGPVTGFDRTGRTGQTGPVPVRSGPGRTAGRARPGANTRKKYRILWIWVKKNHFPIFFSKMYSSLIDVVS